MIELLTTSVNALLSKSMSYFGNVLACFSKGLWKEHMKKRIYSTMSEWLEMQPLLYFGKDIRFIHIFKGNALTIICLNPIDPNRRSTNITTNVTKLLFYNGFIQLREHPISL